MPQLIAAIASICDVLNKKTFVKRILVFVQDLCNKHLGQVVSKKQIDTRKSMCKKHCGVCKKHL